MTPESTEAFSVEEATFIGDTYLIRNSVILELLEEGGNKLSEVKAGLAAQRGLVEPLITV